MAYSTDTIIYVVTQTRRANLHVWVHSMAKKSGYFFNIGRLNTTKFQESSFILHLLTYKMCMDINSLDY